MRFWTIQPLGVWRQMESGVAVRVDPEHPKYGGKRPWQYDWLAEALRRNRSGFDGGWPWWLSCKKPDVDRLVSSKLPGGREQAMIELELPQDRYATFPLWVWETIYCGQFVAFARETFDEWYRERRAAIPESEGGPLPEPWRTQLESSWELLFDQGIERRCWYRDAELPDEGDELHVLMRDASDEMAALTQELRASDTVEVTRFDALG